MRKIRDNRKFRLSDLRVKFKCEFCGKEFFNDRFLQCHYKISCEELNKINKKNAF